MKGKDVTLSYFLFRIKMNRSIYYEIIPILFLLIEMLQKKNYVHTRSETQKARIAVEKYMDMLNLYSLI